MKNGVWRFRLTFEFKRMKNWVKIFIIYDLFVSKFNLSLCTFKLLRIIKNAEARIVIYYIILVESFSIFFFFIKILAI